MARQVDARDVLDANAVTKRPIRATIVGYYRRVGPNPWDDYEFVEADQGEIDVYPSIRVQIERHGATFRMRNQGRVIRVTWRPTPEQLAEVGEDSSAAIRQHFLENYLEALDGAAGAGGAAVIASKLD